MKQNDNALQLGGPPDYHANGQMPYQPGQTEYYADGGYAGYGYAQEENGIDFWSIVRVITQHKWLILSVVFLGVSIAAVLTLQITPLYKSAVTIEIQKTETQILKESAIEPAVVADAEYLATQYELLKSRSLAERVAEILNLPSDERYADQDLPRSERLAAAADIILEGLRVVPRGRSRIVSVQYISPYPRETSRVANALVQNFIETNLERKYNTTAYARQFLQERLQNTKVALEESERQLADYANEQDILDLNTSINDTGVSLEVNSLIALNEELATTENERIEAEQRYLDSLSNPDALFFLQNEDLRRLREDISILQAEYQEMLGTFKPGFPAMINLQARIDAKTLELDAAKAVVIRALEGDYQSAVAREATLRLRIDELKSQLQELRDRRINYTILQREVDTNRSQYEGLLQRLKEISISSGVGSSQVSIIDSALVPTIPFEPNLIRSLIQALVLSFVVGIGVAFCLDYIDDTIKSTDDVKNKLALPTITVVPVATVNKAADNMIINALQDPKSGVSEAFFAARTALSFSSASGVPKSLTITSTEPGEGKTSTTIALAIAFAKVGQRVVIVDADMRKPSFVADANASIGLSGLLTRNAAIADNIVESSIERLHLLPSGTIPPNPAELLSSPRLAEIIHKLEDIFDLVIIDAPPVLSFADAPLLSSVSGGSIMVVEAGRIRRPNILSTISRMRTGRTNLLGVVLTKFDAKKFGYDYAYSSYAYAENYGQKNVEAERSTKDMRKIMLFSDKFEAHTGNDI